VEGRQGADPPADAGGGQPPRYDLLIRDCRIDGLPQPVDIAIEGSWIRAVGPHLAAGAALELAAGGRLASPAFVQPHLHLDKAGVGPLIGVNQSGTLAEAIRLLQAAKRTATADEIAQRAGRIIELAVMAGTSVIRSHVDVDTIGGLTPLEGVLRAAREHADICDVQLVAFPQEGLLRDPGADVLMAAAMRAGATVVGGMPHWEQSPRDAAEHVRICLDLAREHDADVDMHIDETDDPRSRTLEMLLDATEKYGWQGRVAASHCCAMTGWETDYTSSMIARAAALGVSVITNPATNLLLQGRGDGAARRRGLPPVKDLLAAGVRVACGQDCVHDAFYPFGTGDPLQVALILCHAAQLSTPCEIESGMTMIRSAAAAVLGYQGYGLAPGCLADVVVLDAETAEEALRAQAARRFVIRHGRLVAETAASRKLHRQAGYSPSHLVSEFTTAAEIPEG
jgi:cytosine/creatinine deaminase